MKTAEEILDNVMCCTIEEDAEDVKENYYYKHNDVVKAIEQAQKEAFKEGSSQKIKQLEWKESEVDNDILIAKSPFGDFYQIDVKTNKLYINGIRHSLKTLDAAKAAAQAVFLEKGKEYLE